MLVALLCPSQALAVLQVDGHGPVLDAGGFRMRVTNAGILGNAFLNQGRSFDPSFEFPPTSGQEVLNFAALWVGARMPDGRVRVSGGPLLEWRPDPDPASRVFEARSGRLGGRRLIDDDGDGAIDEEVLNGLDDDGDGEVDEDIGLPGDHALVAEYVDDRPEALAYAYEDGETHVPLGLTVHQEAYAWATPGFEKTAGLQFLVTNHSGETLEQVYLGLFADLDSRLRDDPVGHLNDRVEMADFERSMNDGTPWSNITINGVVPGPQPPPPPRPCITRVARTVPMLRDGAPGSALPHIAVVPLEHTTDPLALITPARSYARAPATVSFRIGTFANRGVPGQGGVPRLDRDRYAALAGQLQQTSRDLDDLAVLVSCGPFPRLGPGESLFFSVALVAGEDADSLAAAIGNTLYLHHGSWANLQPDYQGPDSTEWDVGETGRNGHEACIAAPPGVEFDWDSHCISKLDVEVPFPPTVHYTSGHCVWTDADCNACTGFNGNETRVRWLDPGDVPPPPRRRIVARNHEVAIEWDNTPEVMLAGRQYGTAESRFIGYRIYRLGDWRGRNGLSPPAKNWEVVASVGVDSLNGSQPLSTVTDTTVAPERVLFEEQLYPPGRYRWVDRSSLNGFDYLYDVTAVYELLTRLEDGTPVRSRMEGPILATFADRVTPQASAQPRVGAVWVVPNPFRAGAGWDRPPVYGDAQTRHIDFMGLPRARATIKIWTVAGDLVDQIDHDGSSGDGQASWDLISRNGQDVESGIYLFTVESSVGTQTGKFVVIR